MTLTSLVLWHTVKKRQFITCNTSIKSLRAPPLKIRFFEKISKLIFHYRKMRRLLLFQNVYRFLKNGQFFIDIQRKDSNSVIGSAKELSSLCILRRILKLRFHHRKMRQLLLFQNIYRFLKGGQILTDLQKKKL